MHVGQARCGDRQVCATRRQADRERCVATVSDKDQGAEAIWGMPREKTVTSVSEAGFHASRLSFQRAERERDLRRSVRRRSAASAPRRIDKQRGENRESKRVPCQKAAPCTRSIPLRTSPPPSWPPLPPRSPAVCSLDSAASPYRLGTPSDLRTWLWRMLGWLGRPLWYRRGTTAWGCAAFRISSELVASALSFASMGLFLRCSVESRGWP